jgi:hypothetical protein
VRALVPFKLPQDDSTVGCPKATTEEHGYENPGNPTPSGSRILAIGILNAKTVRVVGKRILGCPRPPASSMVSVLQGNGVGIGHTPLPQGQMKITIFVHNAMCGVNTSPPIMMGINCTSTVARNGLIAERGISGVGGHQHVKFLMTML